MKTLIIFVALSVCFAFSNNPINATGFEDFLRLRSKSATLNEGGFIFRNMFDQKKYCKAYYIRNRKKMLLQAKEYYHLNNKIIKREIKICVFCNKEFHPRSNKAICCSIKCIWKERNRKNNKANQISKKCKYCNGGFINSIKTRIYCSEKCRNKWWKKKKTLKEIRKCLYCLKSFNASNIYRKYCSKDCYKKYWEVHSDQFVIDKERQKQYRKWYVKSTPLRKLRCQLSDRIRKHLRAKGLKKDTELKKILGCSVLELMKYLESQFEAGMSWEKHKVDGWHIDHKIPLCSAKTKREIYKLWHYTNLQPLWAIDNLKKGGKREII
ncbi:hypothetical protein LCGC14_1312330 [marine sediment metagenome]|uniref:Uncharacterized protein n=1 Tax=marine sediment metagenome TaxID=412755 RepID=A0A0F9N2V4_9ZZZZ|nr:hypothetical protein [bacterium]